MRLKDAIITLREQKEKIETEADLQDHTWIVQTRSYIKQFFGEDSHEYKFAEKFTFGNPVFNVASGDFVRPPLEFRIGEARRFLDKCIETLQKRGKLYKPPQINFLYRIPNGWLAIVLPLALIGVCTLCFMAGENKSSALFLKQEMRIKELEDSLSVYSSLSIPNQIADKAAKANNARNIDSQSRQKSLN